MRNYASVIFLLTIYFLFNRLQYLPMHFGMYLSFIILHISLVGRLLNDVLPYGLTCINRIHLFPYCKLQVSCYEKL